MRGARASETIGGSSAPLGEGASQAMSFPVDNSVEIAVGLLHKQLPADMVVVGEATIEAVKLWNANVHQRPAVIARCRTADDVQTAVLAAQSAGLPLSVLGGGHDWGGAA